MMFGFRDEFKYFQCPQCECLQIAEVPENLSKYYPDNYYSFNVKTSADTKKGLKEKMMIERNRSAALGTGLVGFLLNRVYPTEIFDPLRIAGLKKDNSILDVGCGNGKLLFMLQEMGCTDLTGVDPFLDEDIIKKGVNIYKKFITEVEGKWDFIMLNHSFEHMDNPLETFRKIYDLLNEEGTCMIRIPVASSYAWEKYRENWVQLDAPRHIFLHSGKSMELLAEQAGLKITNIFYDSGAFQFWGSEQYKKDIPLVSSESHSFRKDEAIFTKDQINRFHKEAIRLNKEKKGDMCAFYLKKNNA